MQHLSTGHDHAKRPVTFREIRNKGMDGRAALAQTTLSENPFSGQVFVFRGRRGVSGEALVLHKVKIPNLVVSVFWGPHHSSVNTRRFNCSFLMPSSALFFLSAFMILLSLSTQRKAYRINCDFVAAVLDPKHPEHHELLQWYGGPFDPYRFDIDNVNAQLKRIKL